MLAAWTRLKYPAVFAGAIAASAPIRAFPGLSPAWDSESYWAVVTRDATPAAGAAAACAPNTRAAWDAIDAMAAAGPAGLANLTSIFQVCTPLATADDIAMLKLSILNAIDTLAMGNYPYPR